MKSLNQYNPYDDEYGVPSLPLFSDQNEEERGHLAMSGNDPPEEVMVYFGRHILQFKPKYLSLKTKDTASSYSCCPGALAGGGSSC